MPRLVRLTTNDNNCRFRAKFGQGFMMPANSKVALHNLSLTLENKEIEIDSSNDLITYSISQTIVSRQARITKGIYNVNNIDLLLNNITNALNRMVSYNSEIPDFTIGKEIGLEWRAAINPTSKKVNIEYKISQLANPKLNYTLVNARYIPATGEYNSSQTGGFLYLNKYLCRGGGMYSFKILGLPATGATTPIGYMGFTDVNPDDRTGPLTITDIRRGIAIYENGQGPAGSDYHSISDGVITVGAFVPKLSAAQDTVMIGRGYNYPLNQTDIGYYIYDNAGAESPIDVLTDPLEGVKLYPVFIWGAQNLTLNRARFTVSPFLEPNEDNEDADHESLGAIPTQGQYNRITNVFFKFFKNNLAEFLGFDKLRYPEAVGTYTRARDTYLIAASKLLNPGIKGNNLIVELENMPLNSRNFNDDEEQNGRRLGILATVPQEDSDFIVTYQPKYPLYLDLDNSSDKEVKNINIRVLDRDLTPIVIDGEAVAVLLFN